MNNKITIWKCITCPAGCPLPFGEIYENPHVCPNGADIKADFRMEEVSEEELLKMFKGERP